MSNLFEYLAHPDRRPAPPPELRRAAVGAGGRASASRTWASAIPARDGAGRCAHVDALHPARAEPGAGRAERRRQDDVHQAADAALRADRGAHPPRRERPARPGTRQTLRAAHRRHLPGLQPVPVHGCARTSASAASSTSRTSRGSSGRSSRGGADEVVGDAARGARDAARPLVQGRRRALRRPVAEGGARARLHARGGGHPGPRRADRGARRRGRARHLRALPAAGRTGAPRSSSRTASPTVRMADRIVVIEQGQIVEQGTHEELVARAARATRTSSRCRRRATSERPRGMLRPALGAPRQLDDVGRGGRRARASPSLGRAWRRRYLELTSTVGALPAVPVARGGVGHHGRPPGGRGGAARAGWDGLRRGPTCCPRSVRCRFRPRSSPTAPGHGATGGCLRGLTVRRGGHRGRGRCVQAGPRAVPAGVRAARPRAP